MMMESSQTTTPSGGNYGNMTEASPPVESSTSATTNPIDDQNHNNLQQVINSTEKTLGILHQLSLTVSSNNVGSQLLNNLVMELDNMTKAADKCSNIQVPVQVINLVDEGKNPDQYTRDVFDSCIAKNQITKRKTDAYKALRKHMMEELEQAFPHELQSYRETRLVVPRYHPYR